MPELEVKIKATVIFVSLKWFYRRMQVQISVFK